MKIHLLESDLDFIIHLIKKHIKKLDKDIKNFKGSDVELDLLKQRFKEVKYLKESLESFLEDGGL